MMPTVCLPSPIYRADSLSKLWNVDLWLKRDDLIPQFLGGNKVRKNVRILSHAFEREGIPDLLITNGGAQSNHARVLALLGAQIGCAVHLVLHGERPPDGLGCGNSFFYDAAGAKSTYVASTDIGAKISEIAEEARSVGKRVLVVPGGGHSLEGVEAYADAVSELPFEPDFIVVASGTGGTQAGLIVGVTRSGMKTRVIGISVAREHDRGANAVRALLSNDLGGDLIEFKDDYRFGGYELSSPELVDFLKAVARVEGLPLDLTYTGKAMFGLSRLLLSGEIGKGSKVVFWHTGGMLNANCRRQ
ncbi:pyridoxal-phosphate dependent enzyme [Variovorax sp. J22R133]|uniref:1-aminocyclopropane-1-carboxylate deaminase/D-cysteine desulfhydrase n=1 Tax=Variovorax brevis TaxID=3053503 RepID=UPI002577E00A|nr:pyridoxal-phosphate dependent enzyme [Variovorax sp. J22R133]MDM0110731.1 pyridoxal-phosphate dependent enzyme [Variovorax sp. J22R133]